MIVWPGLRRSVSAISRLFNSATFDAPLTHSLSLSRGTGTATFTRATTATVRDNEGVLRTAIAGEARFEGARRIRNLIAGSSEDLANASWSSILVTAPTPTTVLATAGAGAHHRFNAGPAAVAGNTYVLQAKLTAGTARYAVLGDRGDAVYRSVTFDLQTGTKGAEHNATGTMEDLGGGQYLCTAKFVRTNGGTALYLAVGITDSNSSYIESGFVAAGTETIIAEEIQLEDVTAQTTQTAGEYVSVGVLSAPYHGAGVDGVKYFDTDLSGNPIPAATMLGYQAEGARTNHFLQSGTPATQTSGALSTGTYTLWMDGTGSIAVAGATATITGAGTATSSTAVTFVVTVAGTVTYTVTGSPTRAQSENGAQRSSYIPTTTLAVARNADVLTYPSAGNIDGTKGACYSDINLNSIDTASNNWVVVRDNDKGILYSNGTDGQVVIFDGIQGAVKSGLGTFVRTQTKIASTWGGSAQAVTGDGLTPATAAFDGSLDPVATIGIGANGTGYLWGHVRNVRIWNRALSNSELQGVTSA